MIEIVGIGPFVVSAPVRNDVTRESVTELIAELREREVDTSFLYGEDRWEPGADRTPPLGFVSAARRRARTVVTDDLFSSPTEVRSLAALLWSLEGKDGEDVLHAVGGPRVCRLDVLGATLEVWGLSSWPGIEVVHADAEGRIPGQTLRRPRDSSLDSSRLRALTGSSLPELRLRVVSATSRLFRHRLAAVAIPILCPPDTLTSEPAPIR
jgi:dTDP-4-dehydrorhamnose reductase